MRTITVAIFLLLLMALPLPAQQSTSYKLKEHVLNAGGHPENGVIMSSPGFKVSLDSIGKSVSAAVLGSASFHMDAGFVNTFRPAGEISGLIFLDKNQLQWSAEPSASFYNLYRGTIGAVAELGYGACLKRYMTSTTTSDTDPVSDGGFFYLATVENRLGEEGSKGFQTGGLERQGSVCP